MSSPQLTRATQLLSPCVVPNVANDQQHSQTPV